MSLSYVVIDVYVSFCDGGDLDVGGGCELLLFEVRASWSIVCFFSFCGLAFRGIRQPGVIVL